MYLRVVLIVLFLASNSLVAQETRGTIRGTVTDAQGAVVPNASVVITNTATNASSRLVTNATGYYEAPLLLPGGYELTAEAPGFRRAIRSGVNLASSQQTNVDFRLEVGSLTEAVSVTAEAPLLDTTAVSSGTSLTSQDLTNLPSVGSIPVLLVKMTPGVATDGNMQFVANGFTGGTSNYRAPEGVGGNEWSIDGMSNNGGGRNVASTPNAEMLQEMRVETSNFDASFGHGAGISVSMMTRSGVNEPHGSGSWQYWNQRWNASSFFAKQNYYLQIARAEADGNTALAKQLASKPIQQAGHANSESATFGGPVYIPKLYDGRNKLFFFFNQTYEDDLITADPSDEISYTIPTMAARQGNFSQLLNVDPVRYQIYDPLTVRPDPARPTHVIRTPMSGNLVPESRIINPAYKTYTGFLPPPNNDPVSANLEPLVNMRAYGEDGSARIRLYGGRLDYNLSEKHRFYFRTSWSHYVENNGAWLYNGPVPRLQEDYKTRDGFSGSLDWTFSASASTVWNVQVGANDFEESFPRLDNAEYKPSSVGLPAYMDQQCGRNCALPIMNWSGYTSLGKTAAYGTHWRQISQKVNLMHIQGAHTLRAGLDSRQHFRTYRSPGANSGSFSFTNEFTRRADDTSVYPAGDLGLSWAAFMMGVPSTITADVNADFAIYNPYYGGYFQDSWRLGRDLTVNLGLRFEWEGGLTERYNRMITDWDPTVKLPISDAAMAAYAAKPVAELQAANFVVRGGPNYATLNGRPRAMWDGETMWLPRVSAAWQLGQRMVLRGGYGWYYDTLNAQVNGITQTGYSRPTTPVVTTDFGQTWLVGNPAAGISALKDPFPLRADGTRFDAPYGNRLGYMSVAGGSFSNPAYDNRKHARLQRWRIGLQRQIGSSMVVEAAYAGSYGDRVDVSQTLSSLPQQYWNTTLVRNSTLASNLNSNVTNPFYIENFASLQSSQPLVWDRISKLSFFTSKTIQKNRLLREFPQMTGVTRTANPLGVVKNAQFDFTLQRRFSKGLSVNAGLTLFRVQERLWLQNEYDRVPETWEPGNTSRPYRFTSSFIYQLPFGPQRSFLKTGVLSQIVGGWQMAGTIEAQPGPLLSWGNLFFYGNIDDIQVDTPTFNRWFNVDAGFERNSSKTPASYQARVFPRRIDGLRADGSYLVNGNIERSFQFLEKFNLTLRLDAINVLNRSQFAAPNLTPTSTDFGKITATTDTLNRFIQIQARVRF